MALFAPKSRFPIWHPLSEKLVQLYFIVESGTLDGYELPVGFLSQCPSKVASQRVVSAWNRIKNWLLNHMTGICSCFSAGDATVQWYSERATWPESLTSNGETGWTDSRDEVELDSQELCKRATVVSQYGRGIGFCILDDQVSAWQIQSCLSISMAFGTDYDKCIRSALMMSSKQRSQHCLAVMNRTIICQLKQVSLLIN